MRVAPVEDGLELNERCVACEGGDQTREIEFRTVTDDGDAAIRGHQGDICEKSGKKGILGRTARPKTAVKFPREKSAVDTSAGAATPATFVESGHVHCTRSITSIDQTPRFRRPNFGMSQIIPTLCLIGIIIAIVACLSILLPAQLGLKLSTVDDDTNLAINAESRMVHGRPVIVVCTKEPPSPGCLVWDWKQGNYELGTIINYWCAPTTSYVVYATVECVSNRTWVVTTFSHELPCSCKMKWLQPHER